MPEHPEVEAWYSKAMKLEAEVERLRTEGTKFIEAVGLMSTALPKMQVDVENPVGMAQLVVAKVERLRTHRNALQELLACYRLGKHPSEKLLEKLVDLGEEG